MENVEAVAAEVSRRILIEVEASGRHVHVTKAQAHALFGHDLTPKRPLSQPGQFLCQERVTLVGPKGEIPNVAVLGPARSEGQAELSLTDGVSLGLDLPVRLSGDVKGSPAILLRGPLGQVELPCGAIAARRHIHLPPDEAKHRGLRDRQVVKLRMVSTRPTVFEDVVVRVHKDFAPRAHIDYDEANACAFRKGDFGVILHG